MRKRLRYWRLQADQEKIPLWPANVGDMMLPSDFLQTFPSPSWTIPKLGDDKIIIIITYYQCIICCAFKSSSHTCTLKECSNCYSNASWFFFVFFLMHIPCLGHLCTSWENREKKNDTNWLCIFWSSCDHERDGNLTCVQIHGRWWTPDPGPCPHLWYSSGTCCTSH